MTNQTDIFLKSEADAWHERNKNASYRTDEIPLIKKYIRKFPNGNVLEIGSAHGASSLSDLNASEAVFSVRITLQNTNKRPKISIILNNTLKLLCKYCNITTLNSNNEF